MLESSNFCYYIRIYRTLILGFGGGYYCSFMQAFLSITNYIFALLYSIVFFLNKFTIYFLYCSHDASRHFRFLFHDWIFRNYFNNLIKAGFQEMWLSNFTLRSEKKRNVKTRLCNAWKIHCVFVLMCNFYVNCSNPTEKCFK